MIIGRRSDFIDKIRRACGTWKRQDPALAVASRGENLMACIFFVNDIRHAHLIVGSQYGIECHECGQKRAAEWIKKRYYQRLRKSNQVINDGN